MKNLLQNRKVLNGLNTVARTPYKHAYLIVYDDNLIPSSGQLSAEDNRRRIEAGDLLYSFLYNPEAIQVSMPIRYSETSIPYTQQPILEFQGGGAKEYSFSNLLLDTHEQRKSIKPLLDRLESLRNPRIVQGNKLSPPILVFKWGSYSTPPVVLTDINYTVTNFIDGQPSKARVNLRFKETIAPPKDSQAVEAAKQKILDRRDNTDTTTQKLKKQLTDKQVLDGKKRTEEYLNKEKLNLSLLVKNIMDNPKSYIEINKDTGEVALGADGFEITIGNYNGDKFNPGVVLKTSR